MRDSQSSLERDSVDFESAERPERQRSRPSGRRLPLGLKRVHFSLSRRVWIGLVAVHLLIMPIAWIVGGKQTTPTFAMIGEVSSSATPGAAGVPWFPVLALGALCLYQLLVYAARGLDASGRRFGTLFFRLADGIQVVAMALFAIGFAGIYVLFISVFGGTIAFAMNFRLDTSAPRKVTTMLIEQVPRSPGSKLPTRLKLVDWRSASVSKHVVVDGYPSVFDINGNEVTFHVREGAFGWPYAIERDFAEKEQTKPG